MTTNGHESIPTQPDKHDRELDQGVTTDYGADVAEVGVWLPQQTLQEAQPKLSIPHHRTAPTRPRHTGHAGPVRDGDSEQDPNWGVTAGQLPEAAAEALAEHIEKIQPVVREITSKALLAAGYTPTQVTAMLKSREEPNHKGM